MLATAKADLNDIIENLSRFYPSTALNQYEKIIEKIKNLEQFPLMYEEYRSAVSSFNYRKIVVDNYLIFYVIQDETVEIHAIINAKMNYGM